MKNNSPDLNFSDRKKPRSSEASKFLPEQSPDIQAESIQH